VGTTYEKLTSNDNSILSNIYISLETLQQLNSDNSIYMCVNFSYLAGTNKSNFNFLFWYREDMAVALSLFSQLMLVNKVSFVPRPVSRISPFFL
jgi:hypothetical protein